MNATKSDINNPGTPRTPKQRYFALFRSRFDAGEYEQRVLAIGREFLPECALAVLDGGDATDEYWRFLAEQYEQEGDE
jgi:hypothetical protein